MDANRKIIVATGNEGKMKEIRQIFFFERRRSSGCRDHRERKNI